MNRQAAFLAWLRRSGWAILSIALLQFILHLWTNAHDNFFRDELYYMAAAQHLSAGYVEFPPMVALLAAFERAVFGSTVVALRLLPAVAAVVIVLLTADLAAQLGGGPLTQVLAAVAVAFCPVFIGSSGIFTMDPFDQLWWTAAAWMLVRLIRQQQPRMWLAFGVVAGIGLLTKLTIGFFVIALLAGLLLSGQRKILFNRWLIFGGLIAVVMLSPYLAWQATHGFPVLEYTKAYSSGKTFQATFVQYFGQQVLTTNPFALPLWLTGLFFLFFAASMRPYRAFAWAYLFLYIFFFLQEAKFYWLSPAYPMLFASGSFARQRWAESARRAGSLRWVQPAYIGVLLVTGLFLVPFAIPVLPTETFIKFNNSLGSPGQVKTENLTEGVLPQSYADRQGWREMVNSVKAAYDTLTPQEKAEACIFASNYGEAGAVDFYGPALGLPRAISGHNSYFIWGPQGCTGKVLITINVKLADLTSGFDSVQPAGSTSCMYCMPFENHAPIFIARGLKAPLGGAWPQVKDYS